MQEDVVFLYTKNLVTNVVCKMAIASNGRQIILGIKRRKYYVDYRFDSRISDCSGYVYMEKIRKLIQS